MLSNFAAFNFNLRPSTKDDLIVSLTQQAEHLTQRVQELESAEKRMEAAVSAAQSGAAAVTEADIKLQNQALVGQLLELKAALVSKDAGFHRTEADAAEELAAAMSQLATMRGELAETAAARDDADELARRLKDAVGGAAAAAAHRGASADEHMRSVDSAARDAQGRANDLRSRLNAADDARVASEARAVDANAEARRAQTLLAEAMKELKRVRHCAEHSEEQRGEVVMAAKAAAEVLARQEQAWVTGVHSSFSAQPKPPLLCLWTTEVTPFHSSQLNLSRRCRVSVAITQVESHSNVRSSEAAES